VSRPPIASSLAPRTGVEMAAMVDVVFILVSYFLVNATLVKEPSAPIRLPGAAAAGKPRPGRVSVSIDERSRVWVKGRPSSLETLAADLRRILPAGVGMEPPAGKLPSDSLADEDDSPLAGGEAKTGGSVPRIEVVFRIDKRAPFESAARAIDAARQAGIRRYRLAVETDGK